MSTHSHLIVVPEEESSMAETFRLAHAAYTGYRNVLDGTHGHGWQARFYSCPLDRHHLWMAMRYVEMNPVRARMVERAEDWVWSSARAHLFGEDRSGFLETAVWKDAFGYEERGKFLELPEDPAVIAKIRRSTQMGSPLGSEQFIEDIGVRVGRDFSPKKRGRPRKQEDPVKIGAIGVRHQLI